MTTTIDGYPTASPTGFELTVAGGPVYPAPVYLSNFAAGLDSWASPDGGFVVDYAGARIELQGGTGRGVYTFERTITGLTVGQEYRLRGYIQPVRGQFALWVDGMAGTPTFAQYDPTRRTRVVYRFTATATSHVIQVLGQLPYVFHDEDGTAQTNANGVLDLVDVRNVTGLTPPHVYRTDANGVDVLVREPEGGHYDDDGGFTVGDWEAALYGVVTYRVVDAAGGTATMTTSLAPTRINAATNPLAPGVAAATPWSGTGGTTSIVADAARLTFTNNTATDLAQKIASPAGNTAGAFTVPVDAGSAFRARVEARCSLAPILPATVTVPQVMSPAKFSGSAAPTLSLTTAPQPTDVIIVWLSHFNSSASDPTLAGCGAAWSLAHKSADGTSPSFFYIGTGANATGTITATLPVARNGLMRGWLIRGLTSQAIVAAATRTGTNATSLVGPSQNAQAGQIVIQGAGIDADTGLTFPNPHAPVAGWTVGTLVTGITAGSRNSAYRIPTEGAPTAHQVTTTTATNQKHFIHQITIGTAVSASTPVPILKARLTYADAAGASLGAYDSGLVTVDASVFEELLVEHDVPAGAVYARVEVGLSGTVDRSVGDWIDTRLVYVGEPGDYFDGNTADTDLVEYSWAGTAHASRSIAADLAVSDAAPMLTLPATALLANNIDAPDWADILLVTAYDETSDSSGTVHDVIDRPDRLSNPGTLHARAGTLELFCLTYAKALAVRTMLAQPEVAMLRQSSFDGLDLYFVPSRVTLRPEDLDTTPRHWVASISYDETVKP